MAGLARSSELLLELMEAQKEMFRLGRLADRITEVEEWFNGYATKLETINGAGVGDQDQARLREAVRDLVLNI